MNKNKNTRSKGKFLGMPIRWERQNMLKNLWNRDDERIFPPKYFGIGWDLNFHALLKKVKLVKQKTKTE